MILYEVSYNAAPEAIMTERVKEISYKGRAELIYCGVFVPKIVKYSMRARPIRGFV